MRLRISTRGFVRPSLRLSVRPLALKISSDLSPYKLFGCVLIHSWKHLFGRPSLFAFWFFFRCKLSPPFQSGRIFCHFLDAPSHLYKRVCPSVRPSVRGSVGPSVCPSVSIKGNAVFRVLGASYVGYPALLFPAFD